MEAQDTVGCVFSESTAGLLGKGGQASPQVGRWFGSGFVCPPRVCGHHPAVSPGWPEPAGPLVGGIQVWLPPGLLVGGLGVRVPGSNVESLGRRRRALRWEGARAPEGGSVLPGTRGVSSDPPWASGRPAEASSCPGSFEYP